MHNKEQNPIKISICLWFLNQISFQLGNPFHVLVGVDLVERIIRAYIGIVSDERKYLARVRHHFHPPEIISP